MEKKQPDQKGTGSRSGQSGTQKSKSGSTQRSSSGQDERKLNAGSSRKGHADEGTEKGSTGRSSGRSNEND